MSQAGPLSRPAAEASSPELVLVDERLGAWARASLDEPDDTLSRIERRIALGRVASITVEPATLAVPERPRKLPPRRRPHLRRSVAIAGALVAATLVVAVLLGTGLAPPGTSGESTLGIRDDESITATSTPPRTPAERTTPHGRQSGNRHSTSPARLRQSVNAADSRAQPRRFAWAPVSNASGYRIEFFRGSTRIYSGRTTSPTMTLPVQWTFRGRAYRLTRGEYRWYVWAIVSGAQQSQAAVQAELVVD